MLPATPVSVFSPLRGDAGGRDRLRRGDHDAAFAHLRTAIALEDDLPYAEPWGWMQPIRHALGALLWSRGVRPKQRLFIARTSASPAGRCASDLK